MKSLSVNLFGNILKKPVRLIHFHFTNFAVWTYFWFIFWPSVVQGNGNRQQSIATTQSQSSIQADAITKRNIRFTRISIIIVMIFIICHVPRMIPNIAELAGVNTAKYDFFTVILSTNHLLLTINSTVNYIIYFILCGRRRQSNSTTTGMYVSIII